MKKFLKKFPVASRVLIALLILAVLGGLIWGGWTIAHNAGWIQRAPTLGIASLFQPVATVTPTAEPVTTPVPTTRPVVTPTPAPQLPTNDPEEDDSHEAPTPIPTPIPTPTTPSVTPTTAPTATPATHATYTLGKEIKVTVNGKAEIFRTFTYSGGYIPADDPWYAPEQEKETKDSYGRPIYGKTPQELTYNWLRELCKSPHQIIRLRTQMGMITPKSLKEENQLAFELAAKPAKDYDKVVNETLSFFFKKLSGGRIETSTDWDLENYLSSEDNDSGKINLHGRINHDDDTKPEDKDILLTFYQKNGKNTFVSNKQGFTNTVNDAKAKKNRFSQRAWVNMAEGGTWKWKGKNGAGTVTNPPSDGSTSTPPPTSTPAPTKTPRPTKNPEDRPTPPIGGGGTNPQNSEDPHTTTHVESTPAPAVTAAPVVRQHPLRSRPPKSARLKFARYRLLRPSAKTKTRHSLVTTITTSPRRKPVALAMAASTPGLFDWMRRTLRLGRFVCRGNSKFVSEMIRL